MFAKIILFFKVVFHLDLFGCFKLSINLEFVPLCKEDMSNIFNRESDCSAKKHLKAVDGMVL